MYILLCVIECAFLCFGAWESLSFVRFRWAILVIHLYNTLCVPPSYTYTRWYVVCCVFFSLRVFVFAGISVMYPVRQ